MLTGKKMDKKMWQHYVKAPDKMNQIGTNSLHPMFKKDSYIEPMVVLARQMRDDVVFGKPVFHLYAKPLKSNDINMQLGGTRAPLKLFH